MKGPAGVGKSAIAQTCTENLHQEGALGAAFFFSISGQRKPEKFFPSIAYQLSTIHPAYRDLVDRKVRHDRTIVNKAIKFQFRYLIDEPLRELEESRKGIRRKVQVFIDGLDECEGTEAQCEIIRIVAAAVSDGVIPLRWAFFSRPEAHLEAMFSRVGVSLHCYKVVLPISRDVVCERRIAEMNCITTCKGSTTTMITRQTTKLSAALDLNGMKMRAWGTGKRGRGFRKRALRRFIETRALVLA